MPEPHRERRRKRRTPTRRSSVRLWLPIIGGMLVVVGAFAGLLVRDVQVVREALATSAVSLTDVRSALGTGDLDTAAQGLDDADESLGEARSRSNGPLWNTAAGIPGVRKPVEVVRSLVDVATAATAVGDALVHDGAEITSGGLHVRVAGGQVDLAPLTRAREVVQALPVASLRDAEARLRTADTAGSPRELVEARTDALELATETIGTATRAQTLLEVLPSFLGETGPRRYFLGIQTSGELRATGGLIGFYSVLEVDEGSFELGTVDVYEGSDDDPTADQDPAVTAAIGRIGGGTDEVEADPAFAVRYAHVAATGLFSNVNVDPDVPTTARVALDLYEARTGESLDGLILVDPVGLQAILEATGSSLSLPAEVVEGTSLDPEVAADGFARFTTVDVYQELGDGHSSQRKALLAALGSAAFGEVFSGDWDGVEVGQAIASSAGGRHLQVFSEDDEEQASLESLGAAGDFATPHEGDHLAVTVNNAVGGKQDVHLGHRFDVDIDLRAPRRAEGPDQAVAARTTSLRAEVVNPLTPDGYDTYIVGNCLVGTPDNQCFDGPAGHNRSWLSVWTPGSDRLSSARGPEGSIGLTAGTRHGRRVFDRHLETAPESSEWLALTTDGPVTMTLDGDELVYEFTWWRQAKATPDVLDLTIAAPEGWNVQDAELVGGSSGLPMLGIDATTEPAELSYDAREISLRGAISRDATIRIRLGR